jgi:hypothetical protein
MSQNNFSNHGAHCLSDVWPSKHSVEITQWFEENCGGLQNNGVMDAGVVEDAFFEVKACWG